MSTVIQAKLLRVIENCAFTRVGGTEEINIDARLIAATNSNLRILMKKGLFREDLFYRLHVLTIELPPLRRRREDIPLLVKHYLSLYASQNQHPIPQISEEAMECLVNYNWPGNVRELQNILQQASAQSKTITKNALPKELVQSTVKPKLTQEMQREKERILSALEETGGKKILAAQKLGISRSALYRRIKKYDLQPK